MPRRIVSGDPARAALQRGMHSMAALMRPTLGPLPRTVAVERLVSRRQVPEVLDSAALIARRTIQLRDPFEDMGAMIVRHLAWRVYDEVGDGAATAAVIADALVRASSRYIAAGGSPIGVRHGMQCALEIARQQLRRQAHPVDTPNEIARLVSGTLRDQELVQALGEMVDAVGPDGAILVENAPGARTSHEYIDGVRWNEGYVSTFLLQEHEAVETRVLDTRVFVTDYALERTEDLLPALQACVAAGERRLVVIAPEVRDSAVGLLVVNRQKGVLEQALAVHAPSIGVQRTRILEDLAVITGGRCISQERHDRLVDITIDDLGGARQVWATRAAFGILGGRGTKAALRQRIAEVKAELHDLDPLDVGIRDKVRERIGKLAGTAAIVRVGAATQAEQEDLKLRVEAAVRTARSAVQDGVVPGGGAALLGCSAAIHAYADAAPSDAAFGARALAVALAEPMRVIARNSGFSSEPIVHAAQRSGGACVFDVLHGQWVDAFAAGILDPLPVVQTALEAAVSAASSAITAEVLIRRKKPTRAVEP